MHQNSNNHEPVLLGEVLECLAPMPGDTYLDVTAGYGGHAEQVLRLTQYARSTLIDRDQDALAYLTKKFKSQPVELMAKDYLAASNQLKGKGRQFDMILADLGVSSPHLNMGSRGFSFQTDGPLDMRMDQGQTLTAATVVNDYSQDQLAGIIRQYGEEPRARIIARAIVRARPIRTTKQLAEVIATAAPRRGRKIHPATQTFQALRIAVNGELEQLDRALPLWLDLLSPGGRIAIISFHSLEDRLVKRFLAEHSGKRYDATLQLLTKRPITAKPQELVFNPRARSAKLRAAVKIKIYPSKHHKSLAG